MERLDREDFGPNAWLVEEIYRQYLTDPESVSEAWRDFFHDYRPRAEAERPAEPAPEPERAERALEEDVPEGAEPLRGASAVQARRMEESLGVPTATSFRTIPAKLLEVNRAILTRHLERNQGGKVSFTHLIGYAVARALADHPGMNVVYRAVGGKPHVVPHKHVNLGLAVDVKREDGTRALLVPNIRSADTLDFAGFHRRYEELIRKVSSGDISPDDFAGTTVTITNPGMIGTVQSVPRLMARQAAIVGVGAIGFPAEYRGADPEALADLGVGKVLTLTSTYDHRVIQGAESGEFLARVEALLLGEDGFYEQIFGAMGVPYVPVAWRADVNPPPDSMEARERQARVFQLINMYRVRGHLIADLDPLAQESPQMHPELDPASYGFTIWDLDRKFPTGDLTDEPELPLRDILAVLRDAYCRTATVEYMHLQEPEQKRWIQDRVEGVYGGLAPDDQRHVLSKLNEAEAFEQFLQTKFVGHKRFSLEGAESVIPMLDAILESAADAGVAEAVIGMSHRGRLDVLTAIVGKSYRQIFRQFEGYIDPDLAQGSGDVKYHIGATGRFGARSGRDVTVSVASNPSHLESVDPVVEGIVRARQDVAGDEEHTTVLPLLIHGDAAFAGQGVVAETLNLSQLTGYRTGGTVHVIVNNQLGFTTGSDYGRSSEYASDVAKMVQAPIFHVNGDDPEACVRVARLAFEFRREFGKDVVIDMWCYRRWGHNEADDPSFTQPLMYRKIKELRSVRKRYMETLVNRGDLTVEEAEEALEEFRNRLQQAFDETEDASRPEPAAPERAGPVRPAPPVDTGVERSTLDRVLDTVTTVPGGFAVHPKIGKWLEDRKAALDGGAVDWPLAEALAWGTLVLDGVTVRLSGQDSRRGTFSQRHSVLVDQETGEEYTPLANIEGAAGKFVTLDSLLSEFAVVGFEYGYSVGNPDALVMWEAQFGDFVNEAQVPVDQFIAAGEDKWGQASGLVLLLPHGWEGQGPEHSGARLERFLQLAAEDNMEIAVPSTPAQYFHLLRRQAIRDRRKPLVVMTPKSLLRLPAARSAGGDLAEGGFREVLPDPADPEDVRRVILCQGKVYYDLLKARDQKSIEGVTLVRLEQVYPFPADQVREQLDRYPDAERLWVQEEPENMGSWRFVELACRRELSVELTGVSREESASPATGSLTVHRREQEELVDRAFEGL